MIVIPAIDIMEGKCVRLTQGERGRVKVYDADPIERAKRWEAQGAERIHVVDLDGAFEGACANIAVIKKIAESVKVPIEVGGGLRDAQSVAGLFEAGASFVVIGTLAIEKSQLAAELIEMFPQKIYVGVDARAGMAATHGWTRTSSRSIQEIVERSEEWRARGIIFTAIERDGELVGPDFEEIEALASKTSLPIIASGGVSNLDDLRRLKAIKGVEGAIVGKALYEEKFSLKEAISES